jgi:hypothetical protein
MVSFEVRQTPKIAARILLLAAVAPYTGFSQPLFEPVAKDERQHKIVEKIQEEQSRDGPYSADLLDPLAALGLLYQEGGDHALAAAAIERALQVVRINYGLHSLDQAPLIRQSIQNEEARGNLSAAWDLEHELLTLARRHPDDLRTVPIFREIADKRMEVLRRYVGGELPPQVFLGCFYYDDIGSCYSGSKGVAVRSILADAWRNYADAIRVLLRHELYSSNELQELEMELIRGSYLYGIPEVGRRSLRRLVAYEAANSEPWLSRINALVQMNDWELLLGRNGFALETYEQAYALLKQKGIAEASIEEIFSPKIPVLLPTFLPNPLAADETEESAEYIDVAFEITKYGRGRQIEILDTTANATDADKDRLIQLISRGRFRPRVTDGQFAARSPVVVRYYLNGRQNLVSRRSDR